MLLPRNGATPTRALTLVPLFMLPLLLGALWLAAAPHRATPRAIIIIGAIAFGWYLLGGLIAAHRMVEALGLRRDIALARAEVEAIGGIAWLTDDEGRVHLQSEAAADWLDLLGRDISVLVGRYRADPVKVSEQTLRRAAGRTVTLDLPEDGCLRVRRLPNARLQLWTLEAKAQTPEAQPSPCARECQDLPVALIELDFSGRIMSANTAANRLVGPFADHANLDEYLGGLGRPLTEWLSAARDGHDSARGEVLHSLAEGPERYVQVSLSPVNGADRLLAVLTDASAVKTLEAQFVQSQKMQAIGQLAGGIAHDFNNLLTAITGHCDLLMLRHDKTDPEYADLHQISQNANRAAALVGQLLAFSRKQTMKPQILDLRDTLSDLTHLLNRLVGEKIALTLTHDPSLRPVRADRRQLEQVVMNLIVNARDAMPNGGAIEIRTDNVRLRGKQGAGPSSLPRGDYVRVTVRDQGCGIAPELMGKIFDPFFTTKRQGEGTGLGLSTVYGIIKQTGGYIFCDSTIGDGTTFALYFPAQRASMAARQNEPTQDTQAEAELPPDHPQTVLLVEDEAAVRAFAARALRLRGFDVVEADSGEAALDLLLDDRVRIDLFVTDVAMPGMDGPTWVRAALRDRPGTPVIFISGYTELSVSEASTAIPRSSFLPKPFSLSELTANVEHYLTDAGVSDAPENVAADQG